MSFQPDEFTPEQIKQAAELFKRGANFVLGVARLEQLPGDDRAEIASLI